MALHETKTNEVVPREAEDDATIAQTVTHAVALQNAQYRRKGYPLATVRLSGSDRTVATARS